MGLYHRIVQPVVGMLLGADQQHWLALQTMRWLNWNWISDSTERSLTTTFAGMTVPSPIGAAAGLDKYVHLVPKMLAIGFGFTTVGTITSEPRTGNPKPRLVTLKSEQALVNSMGFPNAGIEQSFARIANLGNERQRCIVSIAANTIEEVLEMYQKLPLNCGGVEFNISCPNVTGPAIFQDPKLLAETLQELRHVKTAPIFVKLPRDNERIKNMAKVAIENGADGLVISNTRPVANKTFASGKGGLSGAPLFESTIELIRAVKSELEPQVPIIASGGIGSARDVWRVLAAGACSAQIYTAFAYHGIFLPSTINRELVSMMKTAGVASVADIEGPPPPPRQTLKSGTALNSHPTPAPPQPSRYP